MLRKLEITLISILTANIIIQFLPIPPRTINLIFLICCCFLLVVTIPIIGKLVKTKNILNKYIILGSVAIILGAFTGLFINYFVLTKMATINTEFLFGIEVGFILELLILNTGFMMKNKILHHHVIKTQQQLIPDFDKAYPERKN